MAVGPKKTDVQEEKRALNYFKKWIKRREGAINLSRIFFIVNRAKSSVYNHNICFADSRLDR